MLQSLFNRMKISFLGICSEGEPTIRHGHYIECQFKELARNQSQELY